MEKLYTDIFYYMGLSLLVLVYLVLFTGVIPTPTTKHKYITVALSLILSICLFFVFPELLTSQL
jgi:hypothetical protein